MEDYDPMGADVWDDVPSNPASRSTSVAHTMESSLKVDDNNNATTQPEIAPLTNNIEIPIENYPLQDLHIPKVEDPYLDISNPVASSANVTSPIPTAYHSIIPPVAMQFSKLDLDSSPLGPLGEPDLEEIRSDSPPPKKYIKPDIYAVHFLYFRK
jgi:hypothetical protein